METIYERIGGEPTIKTLINAFYVKVFSDPLLGPFFVHTSIEKLTRMQEEFFTIALGGPPAENEISLRQAHQGRGINQHHLDRFTDHLLNALKEVGIDDNEAKDIIAHIASHSDQILGGDAEHG
jgi:hemoglobin